MPVYLELSDTLSQLLQMYLDVLFLLCTINHLIESARTIILPLEIKQIACVVFIFSTKTK